MKQDRDQGTAKIIRSDTGRRVVVVSVVDQFNKAQRRLQRVCDVVVGRIHGLVLGIVSIEQAFDGIHVFVDAPVVARTIEMLVPFPDQAADFGGVGEIDLRQVRQCGKFDRIPNGLAS